MQVFLQATLDDASRLIPHAQFYSNQGLDSFLDCLRQAISARGVPTRLYMDNAKIYRSPQLARIAASIGILIIHTPPYEPEGRGKIERFFRTVREQFLASLDPKALLSIEQLNERLPLRRSGLIVSVCRNRISRRWPSLHKSIESKGSCGPIWKRSRERSRHRRIGAPTPAQPI
jgi:transposase InsO family protein